MMADRAIAVCVDVVRPVGEAHGLVIIDPLIQNSAVQDVQVAISVRAFGVSKGRGVDRRLFGNVDDLEIGRGPERDLDGLGVDEGVEDDESQQKDDGRAAEDPGQDRLDRLMVGMGGPVADLDRDRAGVRQDRNDGEIIDEEPVEQDQDTGQTGGQGDLSDRREIALGSERRIVADDIDVDPVEHHPENDEERGGEQPAFGPSDGFDREKDERGDDAEDDFDRPGHGRVGMLGEVELFPAKDEIAELEDGVDADLPGDDLGQGADEVAVRFMSETLAGDNRFDNDHGQADHHGRKEEEDGQKRGIPQRADLGRGDHHQRPERGLVHAR